MGSLVTLEGSPALAELARDHLRRLGLDARAQVVIGDFRDTLDPVLRAHGPIHCVLMDGHHEERATLDYFAHILPFLADGALLVIDDIAWSRGMARAWRMIARHGRIAVAADLVAVGVCVVGSAEAPRARSFTVALE